jgi:hypothetical protein
MAREAGIYLKSGRPTKRWHPCTRDKLSGKTAEQSVVLLTSYLRRSAGILGPKVMARAASTGTWAVDMGAKRLVGMVMAMTAICAVLP